MIPVPRILLSQPPPLLHPRHIEPASLPKQPPTIQHIPIRLCPPLHRDFVCRREAMWRDERRKERDGLDVAGRVEVMSEKGEGEV